MENKIAWNNDITAFPIGQNTCYRRPISVNFQPPKRLAWKPKNAPPERRLTSKLKHNA